MNLSRLFEIQKVLDNRIMDEHPELKGQDNLDWKVLALQVELGECANEWRGFKKWSHDQEPRVTTNCSICDGEGGWTNDAGFHPCETCWGIGKHGNPLLEEYVDCLHFILSIGISLGYEFKELMLPSGWKRTGDTPPLTEFFSLLISEVIRLRDCDENEYMVCVYSFIELGLELGFTLEQIKEAYMKKNKVNHQRQEEGY
ncbi:dUTP diphosphatase [Alkalihalophilus marmarensis]|uniref:dUTP diphosphatase n=1 Tax=Alkalihalophilus marmarensis TaxID=521377 RepID=UPI00203B2464|nr:dUTP diphosphatase [Alkalihalophilus marmarensis]MCM3488804.1 dUTP diphosphatase [Alkalihalophilus marmarensis]